jgi:hypothetical protein
MAYLLIILMFATAVGVAHLLAKVSDKLVTVHVAKIVEDEELGASWIKYIRLAVYIVAITGGIEVYRLERAFSAYDFGLGQIAIELYRVAAGAAVSVVWLLLPVFLASLVIKELRKVLSARAGTKDEERSE